MAHNMFPDNLSYGPQYSLAMTPSPASSIPCSSSPLSSSSVRKRPRPLVLQTRPDLLPQTVGQQTGTETPAYVPHHYSPQPPYGLVTHLQPISVPYRLNSHAPQTGAEMGSSSYSFFQNARPNHITQPALTPSITESSLSSCLPAAHGPTISSPSLISESPGYSQTISETSLRVLTWHTSQTHGSPAWQSNDYGSQQQPMVQLDTYVPAFEAQPIVKHEGQSAMRSSRRRYHPLQSSHTRSNGSGSNSPGTPELSFVIENPESPFTYREKRIRTKEDSERQREDSRLLKERGGACVWCYLNKKKCGPKNPCPPCSSNGRGCFRDGSQLWLFVPLLEPCTKRNSRSARDRTFQRASEVFRRLQEASSPQPGTPRVTVKIRWRDPHPVDLLVADISQLNLKDSDVSHTLKESLIQNSLASVRLPGVENLGSDAVGLSLVQSAMRMLRLLAVIVTLSRSRVYLRPTDLGPARLTMFFILCLQAKALCEISEEFCSELCDAMRRKEPQEHSSPGEGHHANKTELLNPVWVAAGLYYRVIMGLADFAPSPLISEIFDEMKSNIVDLRPKVRHILRNVPLYQGTDKTSSKPNFVDKFIPRVPVRDYFEIAFWMGSEAEFPVSTALVRQGTPYTELYYWMSCLLSENFDLHMLPQNHSGQVPGPSPVDFRTPSEPDCLAVVDQETTLSDTTSGRNQPEVQSSAFDNDVDVPSRASSEGKTAVDSLFSDLTWIDSIYRESSEAAFDSSDNPMDWDACFGNGDLLDSNFEGGYSGISGSVDAPGTIPASAGLKSTDVTDRSWDLAL